MPFVILIAAICTLATLEFAGSFAPDIAWHPAVITIGLLVARFAREGHLGEAAQIHVFETPAWKVFLTAVGLGVIEGFVAALFEDQEAVGIFKKVIGPLAYSFVFISIEMAIFNFRRR